MRTLSALLLVALLVGCDATTPSSDALAVRYLVDGQADVTYVSADGPSTARASGAWQTQVSASPDQTLSIEAVSTDGTPVTARIEVNGQVVVSRTGLHVRSDSRPGERSEVEVEGVVEAISADRVRVVGLEFVLDASTRLLGRDNQDLPLSAFTVGTLVEAEGRVQSDGTLLAKKLKLEDGDGDEHEVEIEGTIDAISSATITVAGTVFATPTATRWLDDDNNPISRDAFQVGLRAEAEGWMRDGVLTAEKVKLDDD